MLARGTLLEKAACDAYVEEMRSVVARYGFGQRVDYPIGKAKPAVEAARYIASYLTKGKGSKKTLCESVSAGEMPRSIIHVSVQLTMRTGVTMRSLRLNRLVAMVWGLSLSFPELRAVGLVLAAFPGAELERYLPPPVLA